MGLTIVILSEEILHFIRQMFHFHFETASREMTKLQWLLAKVKVLSGKNVQLSLGTNTDFLWHFCFDLLHAGAMGGRNVLDLIQTRNFTSTNKSSSSSALNPSVFWLYLTLLLWQSNPILWLHVCASPSLCLCCFSLVPSRPSLSLFGGTALPHSHQLALMEKTAAADSG